MVPAYSRSMRSMMADSSGVKMAMPGVLHEVLMRAMQLHNLLGAAPTRCRSAELLTVEIWSCYFLRRGLSSCRCAGGI